MFLFFGVVAVVGSYFVQVEELTWEAFALSVPVGLLAAAILVVNNVRDIDTDRRAGKRTLAVRLGRDRARKLFAAMLALSFVVAVADRRRLRRASAAWLRCRCCRPAGVAARSNDRRHPHGRAVAERALADTGRLLAIFSLLLAAGVLLS